MERGLASSNVEHAFLIMTFVPYDELKNKGFPIGLLPTNVLNYSLNRTSGDFSVNLDDICRITLPPDNYLAAYSRRVTGKLVEGKISELDGIQPRVRGPPFVLLIGTGG
ncbi:hypothetical protein MRB53_007031 [Persea americana]|uniref:Uncharacterized protein n=1 Tax=Persea americana TaxID=3435 RepID=A0ACC2MIT2_PERAE|nr:hypothetical protein MRB53_007031 [Persea americana]